MHAASVSRLVCAGGVGRSLIGRIEHLNENALVTIAFGPTRQLGVSRDDHRCIFGGITRGSSGVRRRTTTTRRFALT